MVNSKWELVEFLFLKNAFCALKEKCAWSYDDDNDEWNEIIIAHKICSSFLIFKVHMKSCFLKLNGL